MTLDEIKKDIVERCYDFDGSSGTTMSGYNLISSYTETDLMNMLYSLADVGGVSSIEVEKKAAYGNCSQYSITISATTSFRYFYAYETGDTSFLTDEDAQVLAKLNDLVNSASVYNTDYEKEKYFHNYLVSNIAYTSNDDDQTPYGALILNQCVCNGYASSFELLMNMAGIPCTFVTGTAGGGGHAWNQVLLGGAWYNVDVTWDDPLPDVTGRITYTYLNVNDDSFYSDHTTSQDTAYCFATEYNAVLMEYTVCSTQDEANAYAKSEYASGNKKVEFLYTGSDFSSQSVVNAVGHAASYSTKSTAFGTVYSYTFN